MSFIEDTVEQPYQPKWKAVGFLNSPKMKRNNNGNNPKFV